MMSNALPRLSLDEVVAGETAVSTLNDGVRYRGYAIEDIADRASFDETAFLLLHGESPTAGQLSAFRHRLDESAVVNQRILDILAAIPPHVSMMDAMRTGASLLAHWDPDAADNSRAANLRKAERLLAQLPVLMSARYRGLRGQEAIAPPLELPMAAKVLWMVTGKQAPDRLVRALDVSLILYADHDFAVSTFAARVVASTLADLHSAVVAAIGALKGPLHGRANERVMEALHEAGSPANAERWVRDALAQKRRIMGFGHSIFKTEDPRATLLKPWCAQLARESGQESLEQTAEVIERVVREVRGLAPNIDWPTARLYHYLGLPPDLYTPLFVVSRVTGWSAHVMEQLENHRLIRPRSHYNGPPPRRWK